MSSRLTSFRRAAPRDTSHQAARPIQFQASMEGPCQGHHIRGSFVCSRLGSLVLVGLGNMKMESRIFDVPIFMITTRLVNHLLSLSLAPRRRSQVSPLRCAFIPSHRGSLVQICQHIIKPNVSGFQGRWRMAPFAWPTDHGSVFEPAVRGSVWRWAVSAWTSLAFLGVIDFHSLELHVRRHL